ncbi:MAG: phospholipase D-like domain-containing protein [Acidobacteriota bacterium]|nr:phospholipase D-like domain-containing protein [Acidobacteriota bacterium]
MIVLAAFAAGYAFAVTIAKAGAPKHTVYELPHDFSVTEATFLPSALPGASMTSGNRLELLENGDAIFPAMLAAISGARKTVNFEAYIFWSDEVGTRFRDALAERAARGVAVRVLLDAVGSPSRRMKAGDVDVLRQAGCHVEFFHSLKPWMLWVFNHRNHRRVLVVDGVAGFTGGVGFADPWGGNADSKEHWRDTQVRVEGPAVRGLQRAFQENWSETTGEALVGEEFFPALPQIGASAVAVVPSSPLAPMSGAGRVYAISLAAAAKEIWIANSYFLPDDATAGLLVAAVKRGVDVRVMVPSDEESDVPATKAAGRSSFGPLLDGGVKIFEYQPTMFHLKTMVVDGVFSTVGSANFDERSFHLNEEINLFVYDGAFAGQMRESFRRDLSRCRPYTHTMWKKRSLKKRVTEWLVTPIRSEL